MKNLFLTFSTIAILIFTTTIFAAVPSKWYAGIGAGVGKMYTAKLPSTVKNQAQSYSEKFGGFSANIYVGYLWNISSISGLKLGPELGYNYYQNNKYKLYSTDGSTIHWKYQGYNIHLMGVALYNLTNTNWNIFGKAGAAYVSQNLKGSYYQVNYTDLSNDRAKILPKVALGAGYNFNKNFGVTVMADYIFGVKPDSILQARSTSNIGHSLNKSVASVVTATIGIICSFGA
ncbi:MAG: outer membrane beta-barrel protein [Gammaproteobacteria bacterium]|jgi:outer membrane immunogenic protein